MSDSDRIWACPRCGSREECSHLVAFWDTGCAWPAGMGCGPIEPEGALDHRALSHLDDAHKEVLKRLLLHELEPREDELRRDLGIPDRLHAPLLRELEVSELETPEEPHVLRDGFVALEVWEEYLHDILHLCGARQVTYHETCIPLHSSRYIAYWSKDAAACARRAARQLHADADALEAALSHLAATRPST